jgi:hypothetical protein
MSSAQIAGLNTGVQMDHTQKQERLAQLQDLIARVDPYLDLVAELFREQVSSFTYTNEELVEFSLPELQQTLADVKKLSGKTWELWESLCRAERPLRIHECCKAEGRNYFRKPEKEPDTVVPEQMGNAEIQALMKALTDKIAKG